MESSKYMDIWVTMFHTKDAINKLRQKELEPYGISPEQSGILALLGSRQESPTPADISRWMFRERSSVTIILNRMVAKGLVKKTTDPVKKNRVRISLTKKGKEVLEQVKRQGACIDRIMSNLTDEQRAQLHTCLKILLEKASAKAST
jgi:MarR family 2-MHQ and catechol resistance regulon transcriptional repressor